MRLIESMCAINLMIFMRKLAANCIRILKNIAEKHAPIKSIKAIGDN